MRVLIPLGIKINFSSLDLCGTRGAGVGKEVQIQLRRQAPSQANVWELAAPPTGGRGKKELMESLLGVK